MGTLSDYATSKLVDHVFKAAYTPSATLYLALCTAAPTAASTGSTITQTNYSGYARASFTATSFNAAATRKIVQALEISFPQAGGVSTNPITHWAICDAATNGNMLAWGAFGPSNPSWNVVSGNTPKIAAAQIEISIGASSGAGFVDYAVHQMLNLMFRNVAWSTPSGSIHFGLATATLTDASTSGTEPAGNGYAREPVPAASFNAAVAGVTTNNALIAYDTPSGTWGTIVSVIIMNALTAGNMLAYDNSNVVDQVVNSGDTVQIAIGAFDCDLN
jgi:hypothetical protein